MDLAPTLLKVFKATMPSVNYIFASGKVASFVGGIFRTAVEDEIKELTREVLLGHPHIYIDEKEKEVSSDMIDPMAILKAKIIAEYKATQEAAAGDPSRDMGQSSSEPLKPASTVDMAEVSAGGSGAGLTAKLANLKVSP